VNPHPISPAVAPSRPRSALRAVALLAILSASSVGTAQAETFAWVQYGPRGLEARAATDEPLCPAATIDRRPVVMQLRAAPGPDYPITTCALAIPQTARSITVAGAAVALPPRAPRRIAVVGDTGCRLKGTYTQGCNDPAQWPFATIAAQIAKAKPDLIIHLGDYHYRETPCPANGDACANSPFGDTWAAWRADFFAPAASLLPVAPWVMIRGNHEGCDRAGKGWSRTLDPAAFDAATGCNGANAPFTVSLPRVSLAVLDVVLAAEEKLDTAQAEFFRAQYRSLDRTLDRSPARRSKSPLWLIQHRPIWGAGGTVAGLPYGDNKTLAAAARDSLPSRVQMMLTGHHHLFQALTYREDLPAQVTVGHGGDYLNAGRSSDPAGMVINGVTVAHGLNQVGQFGYAIIAPVKGNWVITNYDAEGKPRHHCGLKNRKVSCIKG
jgi:hypothetical protein